MTAIAVYQSKFENPQPQITTPNWGWSDVVPDLPVEPRHIVSALAGADLPPRVVQQYRSGWSIDLPDLPVEPRHVEGSQAGADLPPKIVQQYRSGWSVDIPDLPVEPRHLEGTQAGADLPPKVVPQYQSGWVIALPDLPVEPRHIVSALAGADLPPKIVEQYRSGWSVDIPDLPVEPRHLEGAQTGADLPPKIIEQYRSGWGIALPDLPQFARKQALPEYVWRLDVPTFQQPYGWPVAFAADLPVEPRHLGGAQAGADLVSPEPIAYHQRGWNIAVPDLPRSYRNQALPEYALRIDSPPQSQPYGWSVDIPDLPVEPRHLEGTQAGADLPPKVVPQYQSGWVIALPDLPRSYHNQAFPEHSWRIDPPQTQLQIQPYGWSIDSPDLPRSYRQPFPEYAWRLDVPAQSQPYGWSVDIPDLPVEPRRSGGVESGADLPPIVVEQFRFVFGAALPDLTQFQRKQGFADYPWRVDQVRIIQPPYGWQIIESAVRARSPASSPESIERIGGAPTGKLVEGGWDPILPVTTLPAFKSSGQFAGEFRSPQIVTLPVPDGWASIIPDLPHTPTRLQPYPEYSWRVEFTPSASVYAWIVSVDLRVFQPYKQIPFGADLIPEPIGNVLFGEDLYQPPTTKQPPFGKATQFSGPGLVPGAASAAGQPFGYEFSPPAYVTYGCRGGAPAAMAATGESRSPQVVTQPLPYGSTDVRVELPHVLQRIQPYPEYTVRLDFIPPTPTIFGAWLLRASDLPVEPRRVGGLLAGYEQAPGAISPSAANQGLGYELSAPTYVSYAPRAAAPAAMVATGEFRTAQIVLQPLSYGWPDTNPHLRHKAFLIAEYRIGIQAPQPAVPPVLTWGWPVGAPDVRHALHLIPPSYRLSLQAPIPIVIPALFWGWPSESPFVKAVARVAVGPWAANGYANTGNQINDGWDVVSPIVRQPALRVAGQFPSEFRGADILRPLFYGWPATLPDLPPIPQQRVPPPEYTGRLDFISLPPTTFGSWLLRMSDLPVWPRRVGAIIGGYEQAPGATNPFAGKQLFGYDLVSPPYVVYALRRIVPGAMVATGESRTAQPLISLLPYGWPVTIEDLRQLRSSVPVDTLDRLVLLPTLSSPYVISPGEVLRVGVRHAVEARAADLQIFARSLQPQEWQATQLIIKPITRVEFQRTDLPTSLIQRLFWFGDAPASLTHRVRISTLEEIRRLDRPLPPEVTEPSGWWQVEPLLRRQFYLLPITAGDLSMIVSGLMPPFQVQNKSEEASGVSGQGGFVIYVIDETAGG